MPILGPILGLLIRLVAYTLAVITGAGATAATEEILRKRREDALKRDKERTEQALLRELE
jgi:hypothetical protein